VQQRRSVVHDLVECEQAEVDGHDFDDRSHAAERGTDAGANERRLGQRSVANSIGAELLQQTEADGEASAVAADVFAEEEDALVGLHRFSNRLADRFAVGRPHRSFRGLSL
jgi:hypothetical protein